MEHQFSRKEFFDLMWSKPIKDLAPNFEMSDVALAKICRNHGIPLPGRGYWAKLQAGKDVPVGQLPLRGLGMSETIHVGHDHWQHREETDARLMAEEIPPPPDFPESLETLTTRVTKLVGKVASVRDFNHTHKAIARLLDDDAKRIEKLKTLSYPSSWDQPYFVSPYERQRLRLVNSIFLAVAKLDMIGSVQGKNPSEFSIRVMGGTALNFRLDAPKPKQQREDWRQISDARRPTTDPLQLSIRSSPEELGGMRTVWDDSREISIQGALQEIVIALVVAIEMHIRTVELHRHARRIEHKAHLLEEARKRDEETRRKERLRLQRIEQARIEHLLDDAITLRLANDVRAYARAVQAANKASSEPLPDDEMEPWVVWALAQADRIDPIRTRSFLAPVEDPGEGPKNSELKTSTLSQSDLAMAKQAWHPNQWYTRLHR